MTKQYDLGMRIWADKEMNSKCLTMKKQTVELLTTTIWCDCFSVHLPSSWTSLKFLYDSWFYSSPPKSESSDRATANTSDLSLSLGRIHLFCWLALSLLLHFPQCSIALSYLHLLKVNDRNYVVPTQGADDLWACVYVCVCVCVHTPVCVCACVCVSGLGN